MIVQTGGGTEVPTVKLVTVAPWADHPWFIVPRESPPEDKITCALDVELFAPWFAYHIVVPVIKACGDERVTWVVPREIPPWPEVKLLVKVWTVEATPIAGETVINTFVFVAGWLPVLWYQSWTLIFCPELADTFVSVQQSAELVGIPTLVVALPTALPGQSYGSVFQETDAKTLLPDNRIVKATKVIIFFI